MRNVNRILIGKQGCWLELFLSKHLERRREQHKFPLALVEFCLRQGIHGGNHVGQTRRQAVLDVKGLEDALRAGACEAWQCEKAEYAYVVYDSGVIVTAFFRYSDEGFDSRVRKQHSKISV